MDEPTWLASTEPARMLWYLEDRASARKFRLHAVACVRRVLRLLTGAGCQGAVEAAERYADGRANAEELAVACELARKTCRSDRTAEDAKRAVVSVADVGPDFAVACWTQHFAALAVGEAAAAEQLAQANLIRCIFGNPFRPVAFSPSWRTPEIVAVVQKAYESRDFAVLPVVADFLQDAGCTDAEFLGHCRSGGEHTRGCWVVDLVRSVD
jgi:hypothetical protein